MAFDDLDRRIVAALVDDARATYAEVGSLVGPVGTGCQAPGRPAARLGRDHRVLRAGRPDARWAGPPRPTSSCSAGAGPRRRDIAAAVAKHPEVIDACTVTGEADALVHIRAADVRHFEQVVERIGAEPFVVRTRSVIVLSRLVHRPDLLPPPAAGLRTAVRHGLAWISADWPFWSVSSATVMAMTERHDEPAGNGRRMTTGEFRAAPDHLGEHGPVPRLRRGRTESAKAWDVAAPDRSPAEDRHPHRAP